MDLGALLPACVPRSGHYAYLSSDPLRCVACRPVGLQCLQIRLVTAEAPANLSIDILIIVMELWSQIVASNHKTAMLQSSDCDYWQSLCKERWKIYANVSITELLIKMYNGPGYRNLIKMIELEMQQKTAQVLSFLIILHSFLQPEPVWPSPNTASIHRTFFT